MIKTAGSAGPPIVPDVYDTLELEADANRQAVVPALTIGTGKRYVIGGFSERIRIAYEELYRAAGCR